MKIIDPGFEILTPLDGDAILKHIERCGRVCYKSEDKIMPDSAEKFVGGLIKSGHESVLEHYSVSVLFIVDRGISHEIVRHRIASYSQESTRYCNYSNGKFDEQITVVKPFYLDANDDPKFTYYRWYSTCYDAEVAYLKLLERGCTPEQARAVLPNSLKTELVMTANLREWRHFFKLRCSKAAHPQMREIATRVLLRLAAEIPVVFDDLAGAAINQSL